ncbi:hypothetical protein KJ765_06665 [Candidatus Micrarchaeota archaeon]|nr:hypothetical protein [Candidatus Micrarchaeota archaeon]
MTLTNLKEELRRKTSTEVHRLEKEADMECKQIREAAQANGQYIIEKARKNALEFAEKERTQVSAAKLKATRIVQDARFDLVEEVVGRVRVLLAKQTKNKKEYYVLLEKLIRQGTSEVGSKSKLLVRKEDAVFARRFGSLGPPIETAGGVIVVSADGRVKINNTFEALLEQNDEVVKQKAFEQLFK